MKDPKRELPTAFGVIFSILSLGLSLWYLFSDVRFAVLIVSLVFAAVSLVLCTAGVKKNRRAGCSERFPTLGISISVISIGLAFLSILYFLLFYGRFER